MSGVLQIDAEPEFPEVTLEPGIVKKIDAIENITSTDEAFEIYWISRRTHNEKAEDLKFPLSVEKLNKVKNEHKTNEILLKEVADINARALGITDKKELEIFATAKKDKRFIWFSQFGGYEDQFNKKYLDRVQRIMTEFLENTILDDLNDTMKSIAENIDEGKKWSQKPSNADNSKFVKEFKAEVKNLLYVNMAMGVKDSYNSL